MRLQLALNVPVLEDAIDFYSRLFDTPPYKVKEGYANWEIAQPPLKLVVFENTAAEPGSINHLGVETETAAEVVAAEARLSAAGLETTGLDDTICCFAEKVETWVHAPDGNRWEWYVKKADTDSSADIKLGTFSADAGNASTGVCCA
jgi:catechol 2,3-dioxygenase-like lactoylglutathione lyase family enzyme